MFTLVDVIGVRIEMPSNQPIVLLKERDGGKVLPIWIGSTEASAIAFAQQDMRPARPLTHDLIAEMLDASATTLTAVHITEMRDGIFYAELHLRSESGPIAPISARPSDAIAIALRTKSNILVSSELLASAGIDLPAHSAGESEEEVEAFRAFLDHINPEDFAS
jgi:bifunctional DNase/RNase